MNTKNKKLAAMYPPKNKVTRCDIISAAKKKTSKGKGNVKRKQNSSRKG